MLVEDCAGYLPESIIFPILSETNSSKRRKPVATITMQPKTKSADKELDVATTQKKPALERFRLRVDQQTKASFDSLEAAEKVGGTIKKTHPVVQVSIYDAKESETKIIC